MNKLSMCETVRPRRSTPQPHIADGARHPRVIWAVGESEGASQKPFDGDPYTRLARTSRAYGAWMCWFQGAPDLPGLSHQPVCEHGRRHARIAHARPCRRKMLGRGTGTPR